jgi:acyl-CoA synthetase (AMP-forming)/AMP-acid ligase II
MNIAAILHDRALTLSDRPAIVERGRTITFEELDRAAASAAGDLVAAGLRPGMRALVFSPMSIGLYTSIIGMFRIGVTAVFVDPSGGHKRVDRCIARVGPQAFVAVPRAHLLRLTSRAVRSVGMKMAIGGGVPHARPIAHRTSGTSAPIEPCDADTPAVITFTSGSTGEPKAAVRTHGFLLAQHQALVESLALAPGDVDLTTLPIFLLANLASGVTSVIPDADLRSPGAIDPRPVLNQIESARPTRTVASPAFLDRLVTHAERDSVRLRSFRRIFTGGAPVFPRVLDALARAAPAASIVAVYGSTEAEPIAEIDQRDIAPADREAMRDGAGLLAGPPVRAIHLRILKERWGTPLGPWSPDELEREALAPKTSGEIVVAGDHVLSGYLDGVGDDETKISVGDRVWHRTGDAGYIDDRGRLWLVGRCSARVSDEGGVLYPFAVECAAADVDGIRRSAFLLHRRQRVLVVELQENAPATTRETLLSRLAWARLADVRIVPAIPVDKRHNAKVDYPALLKMLER